MSLGKIEVTEAVLRFLWDLLILRQEICNVCYVNIIRKTFDKINYKMKNFQTKLSIPVGSIKAKILRAVNKKSMSLNEIARLSGVSVPTVARIYHSEGGTVHPRTAKAIENALSGKRQFSIWSRDREEQIIRSVVKVLRKELRAFNPRASRFHS